jgi:hypothetical protein
MDEQERICLDCRWHRQQPEMSKQHAGYCVHFTPDYWEAQGWQRNWGDAAVMAWPTLEILRKQQGNKIEFLVLCADVRRPVRLYTEAHVSGWGSF